MNIPFDDNAFKCAVCNKPLSIPPVLHNPDLGNICGRCEDKCIREETAGVSLDRQVIYENIAKFITFPCAYHVFGCTSKLKWNSVYIHEQSCEYRNVVCPLSLSGMDEECSWIGTHECLPAHIKRDHRQNFANPLQTTITQNLESRILFWEITGRLITIIFVHNKDSNNYYCCISADLNAKDCKKYQYQVELGIDQWENPLILRRNNLEPLYGNTFARVDNSIEINLDKIEHMFLRSEEILVKFTIVQKSEEAIAITPANLSLNRVECKYYNEDLLHDLACPVCLEYMLPPIYICRVGHNVCTNCKPKLSSCPVCRGDLFGGRNYILEKLTETLNYPCINKAHGCGFVSLLLEVRQHELNCILAQRDCFIPDCLWSGTNLGLCDHVLQDHKILKLNTDHSHNLDKKADLYLLSFDNKIFILNMKFDINQPLQFSVQCIGAEEEQQYIYELQIIGSPIPGTKITLSHLCEPLPYNSGKRMIGDFEGIALPFSFLCQFLTNFQEVYFQIDIRRMND